MTDLPEVMPLLQMNIDGNKALWTEQRGGAIAKVLKWGPMVGDLDIPSILLVADCVYYDQFLEGAVFSWSSHTDDCCQPTKRVPDGPEARSLEPCYTLVSKCADPLSRGVNSTVDSFFHLGSTPTGTGTFSAEPLIETICALTDEDTDVIISQEDREQEKLQKLWQYFLSLLCQKFDVTWVPLELQHPHFSSPDIILLRARKKLHPM
uniref:Uncharacterized protein n=1 Tax=Timema tahoe TaxID=61484 RepID=A0A7R9ID50_9NEOP|nr:unnamed protein product [Timema tahoe]